MSRIRVRRLGEEELLDAMVILFAFVTFWLLFGEVSVSLSPCRFDSCRIVINQ